VCHAANELAEGLDFLGLKEGCLSPLAARDFFSKFAIRLFEIGRSLSDQLLQLGRSSPLRVEVRAGFVLAFARAFCRKDGRLKRHSLERTFEEGNVAQARNQLSSECRELWAIILMRQYDERLIGPWRLSIYPVFKNTDVTAVKRLFCHKDNLNDAVEIFK
jgi:hypothetical protein